MLTTFATIDLVFVLDLIGIRLNEKKTQGIEHGQLKMFMSFEAWTSDMLDWVRIEHIKAWVY